MKKKFDILVTDSRYKHSLAAVRALGKKDLKICTMSDKFSATSFSKYSKKNYRYKKGDFVKKILEITKNNEISVIMPVGYESNLLCSKKQDQIKKQSKIIIADYKTMELASDKEKMSKFIKKNKISFPKTYIIKNIQDAKKIKFEKEMIIKSSKELKGKKVEYLKTKEELLEKVKERLKHGPQIVQEYIRGFGCGFFALCVDGKIKASFQHKRINEYPFRGGVSSLSESFYDKNLEKIGEKILKRIKWQGIAMLEFIYDVEDKKFKFIEMNPKFWGSLDLAIESGVNFPYLYYLSATNKKYKKPKYKKGVKFQWILPEDTLRLKTADKKWTEIKKYFKNIFNKKIKKDIGYLFRDPIPTIIKVGGTGFKVIFGK